MKCGNRHGIFSWEIPRSSLIRGQKEEDYVISVTENYLNNIFSMIESDYLDIRISGGNLLLKVFKGANKVDKELILQNPKIAKFLDCMMRLQEEGQPNLVCATIAVTFATEAGLQWIQTDIISQQDGIMWKEAQRQVEKLHGKL
jgi:hypothetical protein